MSVCFCFFFFKSQLIYYFNFFTIWHVELDVATCSHKQPLLTFRSIKLKTSLKVAGNTGINEDWGISLIKDPVSHTNYGSKNVVCQ